MRWFVRNAPKENIVVTHKIWQAHTRAAGTLIANMERRIVIFTGLVVHSEQIFVSMSYDGDRRGRRFEDHVHVAATAPWTHEAASQPAKREAKALCRH